MAQRVRFRCLEVCTGLRVGSGWMVVGLSGLLALGPGDSFNGAERSVKPGLLGCLHLIEGQTQVVLEVLIEVKREALGVRMKGDGASK